jgi:hypothetical protein
VVVIYHLLSENIKYLILSKENTEFRDIAEEYIDIKQELIPNLYNKKLYEYGNYTIYSPVELG